MKQIILSCFILSQLIKLVFVLNQDIRLLLLPKPFRIRYNGIGRGVTVANKKLELQQIYRYDPSDDTYVVDISLDNYLEIFNEWDRSPLRRKDMNHELFDYLEEASYEIPLKYKTKILFGIPVNVKDRQRQENAITGLRNNFRYVIHFINRTISINNRKSIIFATMGLLFIVLSTIFDQFLPDELLFNVLSQGIFVGGWVLLWESFSLFLFVSYEHRDRRKRYLRYLNSKIEFTYILPSKK